MLDPREISEIPKRGSVEREFGVERLGHLHVFLL